MTGRGKLTDAVQTAAKKHLNRPIDTFELRLMPYVQYCLMNDQNIEPAKVNGNERAVLTSWRSEGLLSGGSSRRSLQVTKKFWDAMSDILWEAYVDYD